MCSDQTGKFPYVARSENQHTMIMCVVDAHSILAVPFKNKTKYFLTSTHLNMKKELDKRVFTVNLHVLDNKAPYMHLDSIEESGSK